MLAIRVIPEFDNPGHCRSIAFDPYFREIVNCIYANTAWGLSDGLMIRGGPPGGVLDVSNEKTYQLIKGVISDLNDLFPENIIMLGGDEVQESCLTMGSNWTIFATAHHISQSRDAFQVFINRTRGIL